MIDQLRHCEKHQRGILDEETDIDNEMRIDNEMQISTIPTMTIVERPSPEPLNSININVSSLNEARPLIATTTFSELREPLILADTSSH